mmetsp:Transcript_22993/g.24468  ORF Transcript_22993/g.24468 Transcript_22993/m.24468 type:complete len:675 (+) Transcript_22993:131-2155(+)
MNLFLRGRLGCGLRHIYNGRRNSIHQYRRSEEYELTQKKRSFSSVGFRRGDQTNDVGFFDSSNDRDDDAEDHPHNEISDDVSSFQPWKALLEAPARAAWRTTDPRRDPPEYLRNAQYNILNQGDRTSKQLKRAFRKVLSIQSNLAELRERERRVMVNGKRQYKYQRNNKPSILSTTSNNKRSHSVDNNNNKSNLSSQPVYYGYDETLGNLAHRLRPNFAITKRVLMECQSLLGGKEVSWTPKRILDFGIGCGSASAAAIDLFGSSDNGCDDPSSAVEWIHGIDPSKTMRECSKNIIEGMTQGYHKRVRTEVNNETATPPPPPRITFSNSLSVSSSDSEMDHDSASSGTFDLALFVYTASDLPDVMSCLAAAAISFEKLKPGGVFVMIEPGTPDGFNSIRAVRNMLLDCCPPHDPDFEWEERCHIIAPCTHNGSCPMERHKKNFFLRKKTVGKMGHDLPQIQVELGTNDEFNDDDDDDDDEQDYVELFSNNGLMSETEAFNSSFCSFVHSVSGDSRKKGEKFSYIVAQKQRFRHSVGEGDDSSTKDDPFRHDNVTNLLTAAFDAAKHEADNMAHDTYEKARELRSRYIESESDDLGLELLRSKDKRQSMGRIVRAPIKKKGHVYIDYCASPGRIIRSRVTKAVCNSVAPGIYRAARKSRWGGLWPDTMNNFFSSH